MASPAFFADSLAKNYFFPLDPNPAKSRRPSNSSRIAVVGNAFHLPKNSRLIFRKYLDRNFENFLLKIGHQCLVWFSFWNFQSFQLRRLLAFSTFPTATLSSPVLSQGREMLDILGYLTDKPCSGTPPYDHLVNANLYNPAPFYPVNKAAGCDKWHL